MNCRISALALLAVAAQAQPPLLPKAKPAPVRVLASNGVRAVIEQLKPQCERKIDRPLEIQYGSTTDLSKKIESGESFDLTILTTDAIDRLAKSGKLNANGSSIARCGVGVGIREGAAKPELATADSMKRTLLAAKSITYAEDGASRGYVERMMDRLGIAAQMKPKILLTHGSGAATASVAEGKTEIVLTLASEILPVKGIVLAGTLPAELQGYVNFAAGTSPQAANKEAALAVMRFLTSPDAAPVYREKGMEPR
jgi:molybdate transport system substrate-binding protein